MGRALFWICILFAVSTVVIADDGGELRAQLEAILALDQTHRGSNRRVAWADVAQAQATLDAANLVAVERLIRLHGWPRRSVVGEDAALAAFLVVQHADVETQERYLPMLRARVDEGEAKGAWLALLTDRILLGKGLPQRYGTQSQRDDATGETLPMEIEDAANVNARRAALGMKPLKAATAASTPRRPG